MSLDLALTKNRNAKEKDYLFSLQNTQQAYPNNF